MTPMSEQNMPKLPTASAQWHMFPPCSICGRATMVTEYNGGHICETCLDKVKAARERAGRERASALAKGGIRPPEPAKDCKTRPTRKQATEQPEAPKEKPVQGRVTGTLGMLYQAAYAVYVNDTIRTAEVNNLGEALGKAAAINLFSPFFYCLVAAAVISLVGVIGKSKICMLLALAATIGAFCLLPGAAGRLVVPAVLFLISFCRMNGST